MSSAEVARVFIGSSSEGKEFARELQAELKDVCLPTLWDQGVFGGGGLRGTLEELSDSLDQWDFAVLVATPDDFVESRGDRKEAARDNVLLELGLFCGHLGRERVFLLAPTASGIRFPSDLAGVSHLVFEFAVKPAERRASMGPPATTLRNSIRKLGPRERPAASQEWLNRAMLLANDVLATVVLNKPRTVPSGEQDGTHILEVLHSLFVLRERNVVVTWLRPSGDDRRLRVHARFGGSRDSEHYAYAAGEGLAGYVWAAGSSDMHSPAHPSPRWLPRPNCENAAYLCAAVGGQKDDLGVLAVGSDTGFPVDAADLLLVQTFARALCMEVAL